MWYYPVSALIIFIANFVLGFFVLFKKRSKQNIVFFFFSESIAFWSGFYFMWQLADNAVDALFWCNMLTIGSIFIAPTFMHFFFVIIDEDIKRKKLIIFSYLYFFIFSLFTFTPLMVDRVEPALNFPFWPFPGIVYNIFLVSWMICMLYVFYMLFKAFRNATGLKRKQYKMFLIGIFVAFIGGSTNWFLWYNIPVPPYGNILCLNFTVFVAYAIIKHRFMDIKLVIRQSTVYLLSLITIVFVILFLQFINKIYFGFYDWYDIFIILIAVLLFSPIKNYFNRLANKYFFTSLYDSQKIISELSFKLRSTLNLNIIYEYIYNILDSAFHLKAFGFLVYDVKKNIYSFKYAKGLFAYSGKNFSGDIKLHELYTKKNKIIVREELKSAEDEGYQNFLDELKNIGIEVLVPVNIKWKTIGLLALSQKETGDVYNSGDINVLEIIGGIAATSIENGFLYNDISKKNNDLKKLLSMKSDFLRIANHQLNTPLSIMRLAYSSVDEKAITVEKGFKIAREGVNRLSNIIAQFWNVFELEGGILELKPEKIDLIKLFQNIVEEKKLRILADEKKLNIVIEHLKLGSMPQIYADKYKIRSVISSLLDNAIFYTKKGRIIISFNIISKDDKNYVKAIITDTGVGITEKDRDILYKKFMRGKKAALLHPDGSGLGLYISKNIIENSGGEFRMEKTKVGKGSTFSFTLPVYE